MSEVPAILVDRCFIFFYPDGRVVVTKNAEYRDQLKTLAGYDTMWEGQLHTPTKDEKYDLLDV